MAFGASAVERKRVAPRLYRIIEAAHAQIDRRNHFPAAALVRILREVRLDLRHHLRDRLPLLRRARRQRLAGQRRRADREIERDRADRQQHQRRDRNRPPSPVVAAAGAACGTRRLGIGGRDEPARYLDLRGRGLAVADQPGGLVAPDLFQLIAIDGDVAARAQRDFAPRRAARARRRSPPPSSARARTRASWRHFIGPNGAFRRRLFCRQAAAELHHGRRSAATGSRRDRALTSRLATASLRSALSAISAAFTSSEA